MTRPSWIDSWTGCMDCPPWLPPPCIPPCWPEPGTGTRCAIDITSCDSAEVRVAGYFYLAAYSPDTLRVIPRPLSGAAVADCLSNETTLAPATWTGIKARPIR